MSILQHGNEMRVRNYKKIDIILICNRGKELEASLQMLKRADADYTVNNSNWFQ